MKLTFKDGTWSAEVHLPVGRLGVTITGHGSSETWAIRHAQSRLWDTIRALTALERWDLQPVWQACQAVCQAAYDGALAREKAEHAPNERTISEVPT